MNNLIKAGNILIAAQINLTFAHIMIIIIVGPGANISQRSQRLENGARNKKSKSCLIQQTVITLFRNNIFIVIYQCIGVIIRFGNHSQHPPCSRLNSNDCPVIITEGIVSHFLQLCIQSRHYPVSLIFLSPDILKSV